MATFTVTTAADVVNVGDGVLSLREAVQQANATAEADTINFANILEGQTLRLTQGQLGVSADLSIDGDQDNNGSEVSVSGGDASRVLEVTGSGTDVALADLGIRDGFVAAGQGGGISLAGDNSLVLTSCTIQGNTVGVEDDTFTASGAALYAGAGSRLTVADSTISGNEAVYFNFAGAVLANDARVTISRSVLEGNSSYGGGAIAVTNSYLLLDQSTLNANSGVGYKGGEGGGIDAEASTLVLRDSTVSNNMACYGGGGIYLRDTDASIEGCTIADNSSSDFYGGGSAGGIAVEGLSRLSLTSSTVTGNTSGNQYGGPGGISVSDRAQLQIADTVVAGNFGTSDYQPFASDVFNSGAVSSNGHNIFGTTFTGSVPGDLENVEASQIFAATVQGGGLLAFNGGPTRTVALRNAVDNPAVGGAAPAETGEVDQRGVARPQPGITNPDIGALELSQSLVSTAPSANNDVLAGTGAANTISGLAGADLLTGREGNDTLLGNDGGDTLRGDTGDDLLEGGSGSDWLYGGLGSDQVSYFNDAYPLGLTIDLASGSATRVGENDRLFDIENADGSNSADVIYGSDVANRLGGAGGADRLFGGYGDDVLSGGLGNDTLDGDDGLDIIDYAAGPAVVVDLSLVNDTATRGTEVDRLRGIEGAIGSGSADTLRGDALANLFRGQGGKDTMTGGAGADDFDFDANANSTVGVNRDVITDFTAGSDDLDLATIDARSATPAVNDAFTFLAARGAAFTGTGQVRWYQSGGNTFVEANVDGNLGSDLQIQLTGLKTLAAGDFVL